MNITTSRHTKSIKEILMQMPIVKVLEAKAKYGEGSMEYQVALLEHQKQSAEAEAKYQIRKAANRAKLYEEGY